MLPLSATEMRGGLWNEPLVSELGMRDINVGGGLYPSSQSYARVNVGRRATEMATRRNWVSGNKSRFDERGQRDAGPLFYAKKSRVAYHGWEPTKGMAMDSKDNVTMELVEAAADGDLARVKNLLGRGARADFQMPRKYSKNPKLAGLSALMVAAANGAGECVEALAAISNVDQDFNGKTALMMAVEANNSESSRCVEILLSAGADARRRRPDGLTCLLAATLDPSPQGLAKILALAPASDPAATPIAKDSPDCGLTALMIAAKRRDEPRVEALAKMGAIGQESTRHGWTALSFASQLESLPIVDVLLRHGAQDTADHRGRTALIWAAKRGSAQIALRLLPTANIDAQDENGASALAEAARGGFPLAVQALVDAGASLGAKSKSGSTALMEAARGGHVACAKILLSASVDALDGEWRGPLFYAVEGRSLEMVELLLPLLDPRRKDGEGRTAAEAARQSAPPQVEMAERIEARALALAEKDLLSRELGAAASRQSGSGRI